MNGAYGQVWRWPGYSTLWMLLWEDFNHKWGSDWWLVVCLDPGSGRELSVGEISSGSIAGATRVA